MIRFPKYLAGLLAAFLLCGAAVALACPFCGALNATFSEEIAQADLAVYVKLTQRPAASSGAAVTTQASEIPRATFEILKVLKGEKLVVPGLEVQAIYFGEAKPGTKFLLYGSGAPKLEWSTPIELSPDLEKYLDEVAKYPADRAQRVVLIQKFLLNSDSMVRQDAYNEFAITDYKDLKAARTQFDLAQIRKAVADVASEDSSLALNYTLLGLCGGKEDLPLLESRLTSKDDLQRKRLDALVGCYLTLAGEGGLKLIEDALMIPDLKSKNFMRMYRVLLALRFHADDGGIVPREKIVPLVRRILEYPTYADVVIPDLTRWEDWTVMDRIMELYRDEQAMAPFLREPAVKYMEICPLPKAKEYLVEMKKIDPDAFQRAQLFRTLPVGGAKKPVPEVKPDASKTDASATKPTPTTVTPPPAAGTTK